MLANARNKRVTHFEILVVFVSEITIYFVRVYDLFYDLFCPSLLFILTESTIYFVTEKCLYNKIFINTIFYPIQQPSLCNSLRLKAQVKVLVALSELYLRQLLFLLVS